MRARWARRGGRAEWVGPVESVELVTGQGAMSLLVSWSSVPWGRGVRWGDKDSSLLNRSVWVRIRVISPERPNTIELIR